MLANTAATLPTTDQELRFSLTTLIRVALFSLALMCIALAGIGKIFLTTGIALPAVEYAKIRSALKSFVTESIK